MFNELVCMILVMPFLIVKTVFKVSAFSNYMVTSRGTRYANIIDFGNIMTVLGSYFCKDAFAVYPVTDQCLS